MIVGIIQLSTNNCSGPAGEVALNYCIEDNIRNTVVRPADSRRDFTSFDVIASPNHAESRDKNHNESIERHPDSLEVLLVADYYSRRNLTVPPGTVIVRPNPCALPRDPFGLRLPEDHEEYQPTLDSLKFRYNFKQLFRENKISLYDYGARFYDPGIGRFTGVDPIVNKYPWITGYNYAANEPIAHFDMWGMEPEEDESIFESEFVNNYLSVFKQQGAQSAMFGGTGFNSNSSGALAKGDPVYEGGSLPMATVTAEAPEEKSLASTIWSYLWNNQVTRYFIPDIIGLGIGFNSIAGTGTTIDFSLQWISRGPDASWWPALTAGTSVGGGYSTDATFNLIGASYLGRVKNIDREMLEVNSRKKEWSYWGTYGEPGVGIKAQYTRTDEGYGLLERQINFGPSLPPYSAAGGASNSFILYDFAK